MASATTLPFATACLYNPPGPLRPSPPALTCQPPIDDTSPSFSPWSHPPYCLRTNTTSRADPSSNHTQGSIYCVYTTSLSPPSQLPSHNHTTSLIASPELASSLISSLTTPSISPPFHSLPPSSRPYAITPIPGRGLGLVATGPLKKGEVFMVEYPALLLDVNFLRDAKAHHRRRMVRKGVERLGEGGRTAVEGLERKKGDWGGEGGYQIDEILGINAVRVEIEEGVEAMGLWVEFSVSFCLDTGKEWK